MFIRRKLNNNIINIIYKVCLIIYYIMLKKIYIKNGIIMISDKYNMNINYNIINDKNYNKENAVKKYNESNGCIYEKKYNIL